MTKDTDLTQFTMSDVEQKLFDSTLVSNTHLTETNHTSLYAWVKLSSYIASIGAEVTKEELRFIAEHRLLSASLRLNPKEKRGTQTDLAEILAGLSDE